MQTFTFHRQGLDLSSFEVEVSFMPGLPRIHLSGLPDTAAKESLLRMRAAILAAEFELPNRDQVILNLKPAYIKKQSQGIDLAIAIGYLLKSDQLHETSFFTQLIHNKIEKIYVYGELGLDGQVVTPEDLDFLPESIIDEKSLLVTGPLSSEMRKRLGQRSFIELKNLKDITQDWSGSAEEAGKHCGLNTNDDEFNARMQSARPRPPAIQLSAKAAELMKVVAVGEHPLFIMGPAGTGKTTFMDSIYSCLRSPSFEEFMEIKKLAKIFALEPEWRPFVAPHHSATTQSVIGGGLPPMPGEITRAHGGVLYLDEFLEFQPEVKEALREPVEKRQIRISRKGTAQVFPANIILLATSNLCRCGQLSPKRRYGCPMALYKCKAYLEKLSGPMLDRFDVLGFSHEWESRKTVSIAEVQGAVEEALAFAKQHRGVTKPNSHMSLAEAEAGVDPTYLENLLPTFCSSVRRRLALLKVARTVADIARSPKIMPQHLERSKLMSIQSFDELRRIWN